VSAVSDSLYASNGSPPVIRRVVLRTRDADRLGRFYEAVVGLHDTGTVDGARHLAQGTSGEHLISLIEAPDAQPAPRHAPGLFHTAFRFPHLQDWKWAVRRALALPHVEYHGASDHGVSWAVYLADPDGNGVELAWDKPKDEWPWTGPGPDAAIQMSSRALPLRTLLAEAGPAAVEAPAVQIGHLHLETATLDVAEDYMKHLGLRITQESYPGALFLARGRYHHHLALNTWNTRPGTTRLPGAVGLAGWEMVVPGVAAPAPWLDPDGNEVLLLP
jgi:catechol 2,3-dioxygenase